MVRRAPARQLSRRERRAVERDRERPTRRPPAGAARSGWSPLLWLSVGGLVVAVAAIAILVGSSGRTPPTTADRPTAPGHPAAPASITEGLALGTEGAPLTLRVYSDFQCPVCGRFGRDYLPQLIEDFVVPGRLRVVDEPIAILGRGDPDESMASAVAATCAGEQDAYWTYHDWLFANQAGENRGAFSAGRLSAIAAEVVPDEAAWQACVARPVATSQVAARTSDALAAGINSTPTFVLGGQLLVGLPRDYASLAQAVEAALEAAGG